MMSIHGPDWDTDEQGRRLEPIYRHSHTFGWHHHHTEAGVLEHHTEATGEATDDDGTVIVYTAHGCDHDEQQVDETPCHCDYGKGRP